jgi:D-amino-acid oxidase
MNRREFLEAAAVAALTGLTSGCAARKTIAAVPTSATPAPRAPLNLATPRISWERVIRTTVGLRPHRDSGFVLRVEKFDAKTVIHDYGFGGAGMSLAWGCGAMAADLALQHGERRAAVLGCGSPGLTAARQLQRRGFDVTIYAMTVPPDTTSNMSMAGFTPTTALIANERRTPAWDAQFRQAAEISYRQLQLLAGAPGYGVYWIDSYNATDDPNAYPAPGAVAETSSPKASARVAIAKYSAPASIRPHQIRGPHLRPRHRAIHLSRNPRPRLRPLRRQDRHSQVRNAERPHVSPRVHHRQLHRPRFETIFNDQELVPIKGQFTVCIPQSEINYRASSRMPAGSASPSINPRRDGLLIGNMMELGNWSLEPNPEVRTQNMEAAMRFVGAMRTPQGSSVTKPISRLTR